jgi:hypothetical protein
MLETYTDWMWLMQKITEKPGFMNARAERVCFKVTSASKHLMKKPYIYGI